MHVTLVRQGHVGVIGFLGLTPSLDTLAKIGLLNHPHNSEQDGEPGIARRRLCLPSLIAAGATTRSKGYRYCSRPRFSLNLQEE
ncbi:hypothetical protein CHARACLAT_002272 [Characodon lateralis]|uniref:Uncharacterized protein n=1 Tax=Characodon lateralis TaxID=208331 RepID=A0ABU7DEV2_9TELE|nr:hypothetical protein [Characodon lateralis]